MIAIPTIFKEVFLLKLERHIDLRGSFLESYNQKDFEIIMGREIVFFQDNHITSRKGVLRGLHYQLPPFSQSKLVCVIQGIVLDVVVDIRKGSPTFGQYFCQELSGDNCLQIYIPRGFAHGYIALSEKCIFKYKVDQYYQPDSEGSIRPDDPELAIDWQLPKSEWIQSKKDENHPLMADAKLFEYNNNPYV